MTFESEEEDDEDEFMVELINQKTIDKKIFDELDMVERENEEKSCPDTNFEIEISAAYHVWCGYLNLGLVGIWYGELEEAKKDPKNVFGDMMKFINGHIDYAEKHNLQEQIKQLNNVDLENN